MPIGISVGPPVLTINQGTTFMVTDLDGAIRMETEFGVFAADTRLLSHYEISANGQPWRRLTSSTPTYYAARIHLINDEFETESGVIPEGTLGLRISRAVGDGIHEDLDVTNYGMQAVRFNLEVALRCDFADIFEVKTRKFVRRGHIATEWDRKHQSLRTSYENEDFKRAFTYRLLGDHLAVDYANGRITCAIDLAPGATWHACALYILAFDGHERVPLRSCPEAVTEIEFDRLDKEWRSSATKLSSANEDVYRLYRQSVEDTGALRSHEHDFAHDVWMPSAGVPWFMAIFGRDSLIVSLQNMMVNAGLSRGTLKKLAELQAKEMDDWRDAEPGKIPHEMRLGELAHFKKIPHTPYYGTADATPLYLILLHEAWKWLGDDALIRDNRDVAERCLSWIDQYGDLDGDGFQEYQTRSSQGYENMSWKDAGDSVVYPDGSQVKQPKALCELQGYVFDAWMRMQEVYVHLGEPERAGQLRRKAADLQARFEEKFWCDEIGSYAFALDPDKQPVKTIVSNAGHCLWSGIARPDHAERVMQRLLEPDMWSGWGIRTLSAKNPAYNPFSYQRGSVWPHDNGIVAMGFKRYGFEDAVARVARDISGAASYFESYRLPELYAGVGRQPGGFPVQYRGANVPQAWAAGSVFHLLQAILGLQADAPNGLLYVDPNLPEWLPDVSLRGVTVGSSSLDLRFFREGDRTRWEVERADGDIRVEAKSWRPWSLD
jgi:glycogen debranching enzyme